MSKHQDILDYLEKLAIGKKVSVRSISNHLKVSDGTAYRAIKEAENRGIVETKPRSGTVRIEKKGRVRIDRLTYSEIARISDSEVLAGHAGLGHEFSRFSIGAMTQQNIRRYLVKGGLLIVGDRETIQLLALENHNAILVTGGFPVSKRVIEMANSQRIPVMVTHYDTFTVATMINHALSNIRIKTDLKTVEQVMIPITDYGYLCEDSSVEEFNTLKKKHDKSGFLY
ncbi:CBS domain-containing cytosolic protein [Streptococcus pyogenes]|nr:CBS domain-containing cytosolic protein [Streptococcus pyogenes]